MVRGRGNQAHAGGGVSGLGYPGINLVARQLAALAGLRALSHLNLNLLSADQIATGNAEASGGHLLDGGTPVHTVRSRSQPVDALAAFTGIGFSVNPVHGDGQSLMGLLGNGAVGHGSGLKPAHDGFHALHLFDGDAPVLGELNLHQGAEMTCPVLLVHLTGIFLKELVASPFGGLLEQVDGQGIVQMVLLARSGLVASHAVQGQIHVQSQGVKGRGVEGVHIFGDVLQGNSAYPADSVGKVFVHHFLGDSDGLENLGALVGLDGGNTHLGGNLYNSVKHRAVVVVDRRVVVLVQHPAVNQRPDGLVGQVGVHRAGAVSQKGGEMVYLSGLSALQNQCHAGTLLGPDQILLQGGYRQQGRNGYMVFVNIPVRQDDDVGSVLVRPVHLQKQPVDGLFQGGILVVGDGDDLHLEAGLLHIFDFQQVRLRQDGIFHPQNLAVLRVFLQDIALLSHIDGGGGDNLLPDGVNGRIGYLSKELFKVVEQGLMLP